MSVRPPQYLTPDFQARSGFSALEAEILAEQASSLGAMGRAVERSLASWRECPADDTAQREALLNEAARAVWHYFIQREVCGMRDHSDAIETYKIPPVVLMRLGAVR